MYNRDVLSLECDTALFLQTCKLNVALQSVFSLFFAINGFCVEQNLLIAPIQYCDGSSSETL